MCSFHGGSKRQKTHTVRKIGKKYNNLYAREYREEDRRQKEEGVKQRE